MGIAMSISSSVKVQSCGCGCGCQWLLCCSNAFLAFPSLPSFPLGYLWCQQGGGAEKGGEGRRCPTHHPSITAHHGGTSGRGRYTTVMVGYNSSNVSRAKQAEAEQLKQKLGMHVAC